MTSRNISPSVFVRSDFCFRKSLVFQSDSLSSSLQFYLKETPFESRRHIGLFKLHNRLCLQTKALMPPSRIITACTTQQDFETLEYTGSSVPAETAYYSSSTLIESKRTVCDGERQSAQTMLFEYNGIVEQTLAQSISGAHYHQLMHKVPLEEPTRLLRPFNGPAAKPKRFFRTFWRGLSMRALSVERLNSSMSE